MLKKSLIAFPIFLQQLNLHQQQMDDELKGNPDAKRVAERAREMERTMNEWRKQYGILSSQAEF